MSSPLLHSDSHTGTSEFISVDDVGRVQFKQGAWLSGTATINDTIGNDINKSEISLTSTPIEEDDNGQYSDNESKSDDFIIHPNNTITRLLDVIKIITSPERSTMESLDTTNKIIMRDLSIVYPGGDTTPYIPISDIIIEHKSPDHNTEIVERLRKRDSSPSRLNRSTSRQSLRSEVTSSFIDFSYLKTHASIGIPTIVWNKLLELIKKASPEYMKIDSINYKKSSGYTWLQIQLPKTPIDVELGNDNGTSDFGTLEQFLYRYKTNMIGYSAIIFQLKRISRTSNGSVVKPYYYQIIPTLQSFKVISDIKLCSPSLKKIVQTGIVEKQISDSLKSLLGLDTSSDSGNESRIYIDSPITTGFNSTPKITNIKEPLQIQEKQLQPIEIQHIIPKIDNIIVKDEEKIGKEVTPPKVLTNNNTNGLNKLIVILYILSLLLSGFLFSIFVIFMILYLSCQIGIINPNDISKLVKSFFK